MKEKIKEASKKGSQRANKWTSQDSIAWTNTENLAYELGQKRANEIGQQVMSQDQSRSWVSLAADSKRITAVVTKALGLEGLPSSPD